MRIALEVAYNGANYCGWQEQKDALSIQTLINRAITKIADQEVETFCAGRTDAGVHATKQVIHFDTSAPRSDDQWLLGINSQLPDAIKVQKVYRVSEDFHARFSAIKRHYCYVIAQSKVAPTLLVGNVTWVNYPLDASKMHDAAQCLLGEQDFTSFRASSCQSNTSFRNVEFVSVEQADGFIKIEIIANAFLHHMVRNIVGSLLKVGAGKQPVSWISTLLAAKDRRLAAETAPGDGLYLVNVVYPDETGIDTTPRYPIFI